jgi:hypothetical protein
MKNLDISSIFESDIIVNIVKVISNSLVCSLLYNFLNYYFAFELG